MERIQGETFRKLPEVRTYFHPPSGYVKNGSIRLPEVVLDYAEGQLYTAYIQVLKIVERGQHQLQINNSVFENKEFRKTDTLHSTTADAANSQRR
jgi:hypothetical protein